MLLLEEIQFLSKSFPFVWDFASLSLEISIRLFSSYFCFRVIVHVFVFILSVLLLAAVISPLFLLMSFSSLHIDASRLVSCLLPSFLDVYSLCYLSDVKPCASSTNFFALWLICLGFSLTHFKNSPDYLTRGTAQVLISLMRFLPQNLILTSFLTRLRSSFLIFFLSYWFV